MIAEVAVAGAGCERLVLAGLSISCQIDNYLSF